MGYELLRTYTGDRFIISCYIDAPANRYAWACSCGARFAGYVKSLNMRSGFNRHRRTHET
jgi:hypothetical protein